MDAQGLLPGCSKGCPACMTHALSAYTYINQHVQSTWCMGQGAAGGGRGGKAGGKGRGGKGKGREGEGGGGARREGVMRTRGKGDGQGEIDVGGGGGGEWRDGGFWTLCGL